MNRHYRRHCRRHCHQFVFILFFMAALSLGCVASQSAQSISDSISSPSDLSQSGSDSSDSSESSSDSSSSSSGEGLAYQEDVSQLTYAYAHQGGDISAFLSSVGELAISYGITDWEQDELTIAGIGMGYRTAGKNEDELREFSNALFGANPARFESLRSGYETELR